MKKQMLVIRQSLSPLGKWLMPIWVWLLPVRRRLAPVGKWLLNGAKQVYRQIKPLTQEQLLLAELEDILVQSAKKQNEINDYRFFSQLSSSLQSLLAMYAKQYESELRFCDEVALEMNNQSVPYRLSCREARCLPEPISQELAQADAQTLCEAIAELEEEMPVLTTAAEWDRLADGLIPLLDSIIEDAQAGNAARCREAIERLISLLSDYQVEIHWFWDDCIQDSECLRDDFVETKDRSVPMLYWTGGKVWKPLTSFGYYEKRG